MEWLKKILQGAAVSEDGKLDIDALTAQIAKEMPKHTVTKDVYADIKGKLDAANIRLSELESVDVEKLQNDLKTEREERIKDKQNFVLQSVLTKAGAKDVEYLLYKLGENVEFDESGAIKNEEEFISNAKETYKNMFEEKSTVIDGVKPAEGGSGNAGKAVKDMSYDELCAYLAKNPEARL